MEPVWEVLAIPSKVNSARMVFRIRLKHTEGVLSMARAMKSELSGSQFFIMHKDAPHLDGAYASFGKVIEGMDVVDKIAEVRTDYSDRPMKNQKIKSVTVDTFEEKLIRNRRSAK